MRWLGYVSVLVVGTTVATAGPVPFGQVRRTVGQVAKAYDGFDKDMDGDAEIVRLKPMAEAGGKDKGTVLVFVEERLLPQDRKDQDLKPSLKRFAQDLGKEGYHAFVLATTPYGGPRHQDGLTVAAYRRLLQDLYGRGIDLKGAVFVGNFPQPFLVWRYWWVRGDSTVINPGTPAEKKLEPPFVRSVAEPVVSPADIVLGDMDGPWDRLYVQPKTMIADLLVKFPPDSEITSDYQVLPQRYEDFFLVDDGGWDEFSVSPSKRRFVRKEDANPECTPEDLAKPNKIAHPEIAISRINALHASFEPMFEGLVKDGKPAQVDFLSPRAVPNPDRIWAPDITTERRLLVEYFDRNHLYRTSKEAFQPASVSTHLGSSFGEWKQWVPSWRGLEADSERFIDGDPNLADVAKWFRLSAGVREVRAHSNPWLSGFAAPKKPEDLQEIVGNPWWWKVEGASLVPSWAPMGGNIAFGFLKSLYENKVLGEKPILYYTNGCEASRPGGAENLPFNHPEYGRMQVNECLLMLGNGLALIGRGKVFFDEPAEFWKVLGSGGNYGDGWRNYFEYESQQDELNKHGIDRKKAYYWSVFGDWTLGLPESVLSPER